MAGALGPVGLVITGVAAAAALVAANLDSIWPAVKAGASACANWVSGAWQSMAHGLTGVWQTVKAGFSGAWNFVTDSLGASVKDGLANVWTMVKDFFAGLDFASLIPTGIRKVFDVLLGRTTDVAPADDSTSAVPTGMTPLVQPAVVPRMQPAGRMSGRMAIQVTASGGASAAIDDVEASDGLSIIGSVGRSDRSFSGSD